MGYRFWNSYIFGEDKTMDDISSSEIKALFKNLVSICIVVNQSIYKYSHHVVGSTMVFT